ncbi:MAG: glutamate--tRNA ligase [Parcubacteria group bacterium]|nr:glutamate--tRNA ligase [Parcubacteria group bacterium]
MPQKLHKVKTRFAPSPTGFLHIGSARTALFNYLFAKNAEHLGGEGEMILRIEDTDKERSKKEYEDDIIEGLLWLGIGWTGDPSKKLQKKDIGDEINGDIAYQQPYRQSERTDIYKKYLAKMIADGTAYVSKEEPAEAGQRSEVIRLKNQNKKITFHDEIRGDITFDTTELGDFVIAKDPETPLYHLAVVVDDFEMGITHVIRGEDGISNTPRQILIQEAIGAKSPKYAHIPLILAPDKSKLSKRHGAMSINEYRKFGYEKEAMVNFLALMGWSPQSEEGTEKEIYDMEELIPLFDFKKVQKSAAIFNKDKLDSLQNKWFASFNPEERSVKEKGTEFIPLNEMQEKIHESIKSASGYSLKKANDAFASLVYSGGYTYTDTRDKFMSGEIDYIFREPTLDPQKIAWKETPRDKTIEYIKHIEKILATIEQFYNTPIKTALWDYAEKEGRGNILWPMRYALSGQEKSPDPFTLAEILGKEETLRRLKNAEIVLAPH